MDAITAAASIAAYDRDDGNSLISTETIAEHTSLIDFASFAAEYPEKLFPLVYTLRPEFQEYFLEYYVLRKPQSFVARCHGVIQTRVWQVLRIIEQTIGALIILGIKPSAEAIRPILVKANLETTPYGSLTNLIVRYAETQNYAIVAKETGAPVPAIRKIFRPIIKVLLANKDIKVVAVGAYLRSLTHQASLTGKGLSKSCIARTRRVKNLRFKAPPTDEAPLISFGATATLGDIPWQMLEISSDHKMTSLFPLLRTQGKKIFRKKTAQIFAPINAAGELEFGYLFARCSKPDFVRVLTKIRGISELASVCDGEGNFVKAVTVPHSEVAAMIEKHEPPKNAKIGVGDFVQIRSGEAARYCGTVCTKSTTHLWVEVQFPTGRRFLVAGEPSGFKLLPRVHIAKQAFWGVKI